MRVGVPPPAQKIKVKNKNLILEHSQFMGQTIQKPSLPIKTKIAAWWMIAIGGIYLLVFLWREFGDTLFDVFSQPGAFTAGTGGIVGLITFLFMCIAFFIATFFFFLPALSLFKKRKWAWKFSITILLIGTISLLGFVIYLHVVHATISLGSVMFFLGTPFVILLVPLILLLLDRKNFWKIAA